MLDFQKDDDLLDRVQCLLGERKILLLSHYGSGLYGTGSHDSDTDLRAVVLPTPEEILLGEVDFSIDASPKGRSLGQGDIDLTAYSLMRFLSLLGKFDMSALEMLFASQEQHNVLIKDGCIDWIYNSRDNLIATGNQSAMKIVRANLGPLAPDDDEYSSIFREVLDQRNSFDEEAPLLSQIDKLEILALDPNIRFCARDIDGDHYDDAAFRIMQQSPKPPKTSLFIMLRNKRVDLALPASHLFDACWQVLRKKQHQSKSQQDGQADFKKIYQALRILDQMVELAADGHLSFPRAIAPLLRRVRSCDLDDEALKREITYFYNLGLSAEEDLPFAPERCLATYTSIVTQCHRNAIIDGDPLD